MAAMQRQCLNSTHFQRSLAVSKPKHLTASRRQIVAKSSLNSLSLHSGATTITVPMADDHVQTIAIAINGLMKTFAEKQKAEKPRRWDVVECKITGDTQKGELPLFELFCNPNAHSTAFDAKVLVTLRSSDQVSVVTELTLEQVKAGVKDALLEAREKAAK